MGTLREEGWLKCEIKFNGRWLDAYVDPDEKQGYYLSVAQELESRKVTPSKDKRPTGRYRYSCIDGFGFRCVHESHIRYAKPKKMRKGA